MSSDPLIRAGIANIDILEQMYEAYKADPSSVEPAWRQAFADFEASAEEEAAAPKKVRKEEPAQKEAVSAEPEASAVKTVYMGGSGGATVFNLIEAYRTYGHRMADVDPIRTREVEEPGELNLQALGFSEDELQKRFPTCGLMEVSETSLQDIVLALRETYCDKVGIEYMHTQNPELQAWLQERIEPTRFKIQLSIDQKRMILQHLNKSELFERFLHTKYVGQKRFSLEGGETLIPMLAATIETGAAQGLEQLVIGMSHRGRLNVLVNVLNKSYTDVFSEFEDSYIANSYEGSGDVKYHKGFTSTVTTELGSSVKMYLMDNPSHLESADPVVEGYVRATQVQRDDDIRMEKVVPVLIHGDAALAGQGIVYETMQMYKLAGYGTGGTIHFVINNQIGFTTLPVEGRSTRYCTDIAHTFGAPVFHVNAEDPEACIYATNLAVELRQRFHCDVFIELNGYRKFGHNEADEPAFTQPLEYQLIGKKQPIREMYRDDLIQQGVLEKYMAETLEEEYKASLSKALKDLKVGVREGEVPKETVTEEQEAAMEVSLFEQAETAVPMDMLQTVGERASRIPQGFNLHRKLERLIAERKKMLQGDKPLDWAMAEMLAMGTLLWDGVHIRLSGEDSRRGTFSHRHGMWVDQQNARKYFPLSRLKDEQGRFDLFNSPLSEYGVLGFELGYSMAYSDALVMWEAQFGDFSNGAQIIIDQYLATAEQKWGHQVPLTLLLPHGFEGQGPEHSSARMERFLQLAGHYNMQVAYPTMPAQIFHLLRRQVLRPLKKPLIIFTPKGLFRHARCVSPLEDFTGGTFQEIIDDPAPGADIKRIVLCSGRLYFDLIAEREATNTTDMAIIRIEQLYPLHFSLLKDILQRYTGFEKVYWVQEEPSNMGAWRFIRPLIKEVLPDGMEPRYIGRAPSASPATGSFGMHKREHADLVNAVFRSEEQPFYEMSYNTVRM